MADSLEVMAVAVQGGPDNLARHAMKGLARTHENIDIGPAMYDAWMERMLQTARAHDPRFSDAVERAWRETLARAIAYMRAGTPFET